MFKTKLKSAYIRAVKLITASHYHLYKGDFIFLLSFNGEVDFVEQMASKLRTYGQTFVFYTNRAEHSAKVLSQDGIKCYPMKNNLQVLLKDIPLMMTAKLIFCDNYYPFLAGFKMPKDVKIIQLWHADGACKQFGFGDPDTQKKNKVARNRYQSVYNKFDDFLVGSKAMQKVFTKDWNLKDKNFLQLGYPRTDKLLDHTWYQATRQNLYKKYPKLKNKRVVMYAPTYRPKITLNLPKDLSKAFKQDKNTVVLLRLHPALKYSTKQKVYKQFKNNPQVKALNEYSTTKLLTITDTLITDYSSVMFDYSMLPNAKTLILYWFDKDKYTKEPSLQKEFLNSLPVKPVTTADELSKAIKDNQPTDFTKFNQVWNLNNDGNAITRICNHYEDYLNSLNKDKQTKDDSQASKVTKQSVNNN